MDRIKELDFRLFLTALFAGTAALATAFANYLKFDGYPFATIEVFFVAFGIVLIAATVAVLYLGVRLSVRTFLDALLVFVFVDLVTEGWLWPLGTMALAAGVSHFLRGKFLSMFATLSSLILLTFLLGFGDSRPFIETREIEISSAAHEDLPFAVVHVLLDEHIGFGGFPRNAAGSELQQQLSEEYQNLGFTIYSRAFSQHMHTINAIPDALKLGNMERQEIARYGDRIAPPLDYFAELNARGFVTHVLQPDYIDLCSHNNVDRCSTYANESLVPVQQSEIGSTGRAKIMSANLLYMSEPLRFASERLDGFANSMARIDGPAIPHSPLRLRLTAPLSTALAQEQFVLQLRGAEPGHAYFFHALAPHYPYSLTERCLPKPPEAWLYRNDNLSIEQREAAYFEQLRCVRLMIGEMLSAIGQSPAADRFVFIIHGDHGSRITESDPKSSSRSPTDDDLRATFSTLFAVRFADPNPVTVDQSQSIPILLRSLLAENFAEIQIEEAEEDMVWLDDTDWVPSRQIELPLSVWTQ